MQKLTKSARTFAHLKRPQIMAGGRTSGKTVTPDTNSSNECSECVKCVGILELNLNTKLHLLSALGSDTTVSLESDDEGPHHASAINSNVLCK